MAEQKVIKDFAAKQLTVTRRLKAPKSRVWHAWADADELNKWWGPREWTTTTKSFDFREGGHWHYCMTGPDGTEAWSRLDYHTITPEDHIGSTDSFSDPEGGVDPEFPQMTWDVDFIEEDGTTNLKSTLKFASEADMQKLIDTGFESGYTEQLDKFEEYLAKAEQ